MQTDLSQLLSSLIHHFSFTRECFHARELFIKPAQERQAFNNPNHVFPGFNPTILNNPTSALH
jgi:hypothetical protein